MTAALDHRDLYRLAWTLSDNAIAWLEPTMKCNLACEGCYRANVNHHKSLEEVAADLDVFARYRKTDGISIAGGEPLTHPHIVDIVQMVATRGWKPIPTGDGRSGDRRARRGGRERVEENPTRGLMEGPSRHDLSTPRRSPPRLQPCRPRVRPRACDPPGPKVASP